MLALAGLLQIQLIGPNNGLGAVAHVQLAMDVGGMGLNRPRADDQFISDFLIGQTGGEQPQDFQLPLAVTPAPTFPL